MAHANCSHCTVTFDYERFLADLIKAAALSSRSIEDLAEELLDNPLRYVEIDSTGYGCLDAQILTDEQ